MTFHSKIDLFKFYKYFRDLYFTMLVRYWEPYTVSGKTGLSDICLGFDLEYEIDISKQFQIKKSQNN